MNQTNYRQAAGTGHSHPNKIARHSVKNKRAREYLLTTASNYCSTRTELLQAELLHRIAELDRLPLAGGAA